MKDVFLAKKEKPDQTKFMNNFKHSPLHLIFSLFFIILYGAIFSSAHAASPPALKYNITASGSYYPYYIDDENSPGILPEIIQHVLTLSNIDAQHIELPSKRTVKYLHLGHIDFDVISPEWLSEKERENDMFRYSDNLFTVEEYLVSLSKNINKWQDLEAIKKHPVGTVLGYYYYDDERFTRVDFHSEKELVKALQLNRIEVAIIDKLSAIYWSNWFNINTQLGALHSQGNLKIRIRAEHQSLLKNINAAIEQLKNNGTIDTIINKYTKNIPPQ